MPEITFSIAGSDDIQFVKDWAKAWGCIDVDPTIETCISYISMKIFENGKTAVVDYRFQKQAVILREDLTAEVDATVDIEM